jgi:Raf kinase inhibitor-like YbhB/YbcL family protein
VSPRAVALLASLLALVGLAAACDTDDGRTMRPPTAAQRVAMPTTTTSTTIPTVLDPTAGLDTGTAGAAGAAGAASPAGAPSTASALAGAPLVLTLPWADGGAIDARYTCDGAGASPALSWTAPPAGTVELALVVADDDANGFVHWAVAGIPPTAGQVAEGAAIAGAVEGTNGFGKPGYGGPCPPAGETHTYHFALYALSQQAELPADFTGEDLEQIAGPAALTIADATGTYTRPG